MVPAPEWVPPIGQSSTSSLLSGFDLRVERSLLHVAPECDDFVCVFDIVFMFIMIDVWYQVVSFYKLLASYCVSTMVDYFIFSCTAPLLSDAAALLKSPWHF